MWPSDVERLHAEWWSMADDAERLRAEWWSMVDDYYSDGGLLLGDVFDDDAPGRRDRCDAACAVWHARLAGVFEGCELPLQPAPCGHVRIEPFDLVVRREIDAPTFSHDPSVVRQE